jgi:hypothetical protein
MVKKDRLSMISWKDVSIPLIHEYKETKPKKEILTWEKWLGVINIP